MKKLPLHKWVLIAMAAVSFSITGAIIVTGCKLTPQKAAANTLFSIQKSTVGAYDAYIGEVIAGRVKTNGVPEVSRAFNKFQAATLVALDGVEWNTNAMPSDQITRLSGDLLNLISKFSKK